MSPDGLLRLLVLEPSTPVRERLVGAVAEASRSAAIVAASTVSEALRALDASPFRLAVLDAEAEGDAGVLLAATVRLRWPATAVVLLAGALEEELLARAQQLGVQAVLQKADTAALAAAVVRLAEAAPRAREDG